jgi:PAS domain S-box-containing protein
LDETQIAVGEAASALTTSHPPSSSQASAKLATTRAQISRKLDELEKLVSGDDAQAARIESLATVIDDQLTGVQSGNYFHVGESTTRGINERIDQVRITERGILDSRLREQDAAGHELMRVSQSGGIFAFVFLTVIGFHLRRAMSGLDEAFEQQKDAHEELGRLNRTLELRVAERTRVLAEQSSSLRSILDAMSDGVVVCDSSLKPLLANPAARRMLSAPDSSVPPPRANTRRPLSLPRNLVAAIDNRAAGPASALVRIDSDGGGAPRWLEIAAVPMRDAPGSHTGTLLVMRDMTDRRIAEQSRDRLVAIVESSSDAILSHDLDGVITSWNGGAQRITGYSAAEAVGIKLDSLVRPGERAASLTNPTRSGSPASTEIKWIRKDGVEVGISLAASPLRDPDGTARGVAVVCSDISDRLRAEAALRASEERFRLLVQEVRDYGIIMLDVIGTVSSWNEGACRLYGYTSGEVAGRSMSGLYLDSDAAAGEPEQARREALQNGRFESEQTQLRADGSTFRANCVLTPVYDEGMALRGYAMVVRDVTDQNRLDAELRAARDIAQESERIKTEFLARMSHEIRTPLNGIIGMTQLLMLTRLEGQQREYAATIWSSGELLLSIVNDVLDFSRLSAGKMQLDDADFDPREVVEAAAESLAEVAARKDLELVLAIDPAVPSAVRGDANRVRQVLTNLIGNAIKFTETGEIVVSAAPIPSASGRIDLEFAVADTGVGIPPDHIGRLFNPFEQIDGSALRKFGGSGLGLAICRQLANRMGGAVSVESEPDRGSTFRFSASFAAPKTARESPLKPAAALDAMRVLVASRNQAVREGAARTAADLGCVAATAASGIQALIELSTACDAHTPYAALVADADLLEVNGHTLEAAVLADPRHRDLRIVLMTSVTAAVRMHAEPNADRVLVTKPLKRSSLIAALSAEKSPHFVGTDSFAAPKTPTGAIVSRDADADGSGVRILVVDDNAVNRELARAQLAHLGLGCDAVEGGVAAIEAIASRHYDAVLMDCQMPELDGYQTTRNIRGAESGGRRIAIIGMTAHAVGGARDECLAAGMDDYLSKPVTIDRMRQTIERWLDSSHSGVVQRPTVAAPGASPDSGDGLDRETINDLRLTSQACGRDLIGEMATLFTRDLPDRLEAIRASLSAADSRAIAACAHRLRSASAAIGAARLAEFCADLENRARSGESSDRAGLFDKIEAEARRVPALLARERDAGLGLSASA